MANDNIKLSKPSVINKNIFIICHSGCIEYNITDNAYVVTKSGDWSNLYHNWNNNNQTIHDNQNIYWIDSIHGNLIEFNPQTKTTISKSVSGIQPSYRFSPISKINNGCVWISKGPTNSRWNISLGYILNMKLYTISNLKTSQNIIFTPYSVHHSAYHKIQKIIHDPQSNDWYEMQENGSRIIRIIPNEIEYSWSRTNDCTTYGAFSKCTRNLSNCLLFNKYIIWFAWDNKKAVLLVCDFDMSIKTNNDIYYSCWKKIDCKSLDIDIIDDNCGQNCVITQTYDEMLQSIIMRWMNWNDLQDEIIVPKDVWLLIECFHGQSYNYNLYIFPNQVINLDIAPPISIPIGCVINDYMQHQQKYTDMLTPIIKDFDKLKQENHKLQLRIQNYESTFKHMI